MDNTIPIQSILIVFLTPITATIKAQIAPTKYNIDSIFIEEKMNSTHGP